ncbi:hypothetical protein Tco_0710905 [Tanacetum coccineum]
MKTVTVLKDELSAEQAFWSKKSVNSSAPCPSSTPNNVKVPKELPKVSMVNTSLKKLKHHLAGFDKVVKERTAATAITEGTWGFEHTKACFRDEIIPFVKTLKDIFNNFDQYLIDELTEVQTIFIQMEQAVEQHCLESKTFEVKMNQVLNENDRLLEQVINKDIVTIVMNSSVDNAFMNVHECKKFNQKSAEISNLNASLQEKVFVITALKDDLRKLKGKDLAHNDVPKHTINPKMLKIDVQPISPNLLNNRTIFTIVGNACPLTRITTTAEVPPRKPNAIETDAPKSVVTLVYSRKPRKSKTIDPISKPKVVQIVLWYLESGCSKHMTGDRSQLTNFISKFLGTVKFRNDHVAKIMGYRDYQIGNVTILRVYYVEGLRHNLFFVGQLCDSNLEVAFRQHTFFIRNLEGDDLLTGSRGNNLYTLSIRDMMSSSLICLLHGLVRGLPKLKFEKDHLCFACAMGKSKKKPHKPKSEDTNQEKLYLLNMDLCGPMCVTSVNGKKYILVIVNDYS